MDRNRIDTSLISIEPGVYKFFNLENDIIYIGKAKNLRKRISSYFNKTLADKKTKALVNEISHVECTIVNSEIDALLLENNLIKYHQPKYNILLKDGKSYPYICISKEPFPKVFSTRNPKLVEGEIFGPFAYGKTVWVLLDLFKELFKFRTCSLDLASDKINKGNYKVCLEYHIKNCLGPCVGYQKEIEYLKEIDLCRKILEGKFSVVKQKLKEEMEKYSANLLFEDAHTIKEKLKLLENYQSKSSIINPELGDFEVYALLQDNSKVYISILKIKEGSIIKTNVVEVKSKLNVEPKDVLTRTITQYTEITYPKTKIISNLEIPELSQFYDIANPSIGSYKKILDLALKNAESLKNNKLKAESAKTKNKYEKVLVEMKEALSLPELPFVIECFDNSHLQGTHTVSSMVQFKNTKPNKGEYRKYIIRDTIGIDDFKSMHEVVTRRYTKLLKENLELPNLIVIDGGKGQLNYACIALKELGLYGKIPIIGLAKRLEEIFYPDDSLPLMLSKKSIVLQILQKIRNESHRFAIEFHRDKRSENFLQTDLENIKGIGDKTIQKLLTHYKSPSNVFSAETQELISLIGLEKAIQIKKYADKKRNS